MKKVLSIICTFCILASSLLSHASEKLCVDGSLPDVMEKLMDAAVRVGATGDFLNLAIHRTTKEMAHVGGKSIPYEEFVQRAILLSDNRIEDGKLILREGISGARIETLEGIRLRRASIQSEIGIDFFDLDTGEAISLKGPLLQNDMLPIPVPASEREATVLGFADNALKISTAASKVYVDLMGLSASEASTVKKYIVNNIASKGHGRDFRFVE